MSISISCFKAYDIRGKLIEQLDELIAFRIGFALVETLNASTVVVGSDVRLTSEPLKYALSAGIISAGAKVIDIGMVGTEEIYFATQHLGVDAGVEVTASHNPIDYNGMKIVKAGSVPISGDTGLNEIKSAAEEYQQQFISSQLIQFCSSNGSSPSQFLQGYGCAELAKLHNSGHYQETCTRNDYVQHVCGFIDIKVLRGQKLVVNAGNGSAGPALDAIQAYLKKHDVTVDFIKVHHQPDGNFPNGIPNPLLPENRSDTADAVISAQADLGIAWDGDFDRCFLFDEQGRFIEGYYIVGLLAQAFLDKQAGSKIIYDPRVYWNTEAIVKGANGVPIKSKTGHAFIKERMRKEDAIYGGEMSAHHYFRDFAYCDSGMIPWLLVAELIANKGSRLSTLVNDSIAAYPSSGEINSTVDNADDTLQRVIEQYKSLALVIDNMDGVGFEFEQWRFNLRKSNTEPVIRLNVESRGDIGLMKQKTEELLALIRG